MNWYLMVLNKYATFSGRARRKEYWMFTLFNIIISIALALVDDMMGLTIGGGTSGIIGSLYSLAVLIPGIAVSVRRLHDLGKSGWMLLIAFIPLVGAIWLIILFATDGQPGGNEYGANPKDGNTMDFDSEKPLDYNFTEGNTEV